MAEVPGIRRVRFMTSHPRDLGADIVAAMDSVPAICDTLHLPVQSGSTRILRAMQRGYTREEYLEKVALVRGARRPISITTDVIVGFPGETEADFEETLSLLDLAQYDGVFAFQYSPRPNTLARTMAGAVPEEEKSRGACAFCRSASAPFRPRATRRWSAKRVEVFVEAASDAKISGPVAHPSNRMVNITSPHAPIFWENTLNVRSYRGGSEQFGGRASDLGVTGGSDGS